MIDRSIGLSGPTKSLALGLVAAFGTGLAAEKPVARPNVPDHDLSSWVDKRVEERQPAPTDKRFDEIGWARDIRHAEEMARRHKRPVFLFTHDGRMNVGRC
jgi:hypothetical protein